MRLKVLTYNIHKGFNALGTNFILESIRQSLRDTNADILFLQEVVGENHKNRQSIANWPSKSQFEYLADQNWQHSSYGKNAIFPERHHGNAILSKFPIISSENLNISNHRLEQRGLLHCQVQIPNQQKKLHLFNTHIDLFSSGRKKQIHKINQRIHHATKSSDPILLAGDFNDWRLEVPHWLDTRHQLEEAHTHLKGTPAKSFPCFFPILKLDRIYFRGLKPAACEVLKDTVWSKLSDHLPLLAEFEIE